MRFSITIRQHRSIRRLIEAIPEAAWTPIPYWLEGGAYVAETTYTPFADQPAAQPVPGSQSAGPLSRSPLAAAASFLRIGRRAATKAT